MIEDYLYGGGTDDSAAGKMKRELWQRARTMYRDGAAADLVGDAQKLIYGDNLTQEKFDEFVAAYPTPDPLKRYPKNMGEGLRRTEKTRIYR